MTAKQDIAIAAEAHLNSYVADLLNPDWATATRATKMTSHYLPTVASLAGGGITQLADAESNIKTITGVWGMLETDKGMLLEIKERRIEALEEGSALAWLTLKRKEISWTNLYFFRKMEDGQMGWEGGIFDGEMRMLKELSNEQ